MKKAIILSVLMVLAVAPMAMADTVTMRRVAGYWTGSGGEFTVQINDSGAPDLNWVLPLYDPSTQGRGVYTDSFQSFCVETSEYISIGGTYAFSISNNAYLGGVGTAGDPISVGTAYLYYMFATGQFTAAYYDYTPPGRDTSAGLLQNAIWWLEGEGGSTNLFTTLVSGLFPDPTAVNAGAYPVMVLNLWVPGHVMDFERDSSGKYKWLAQDQLVLVPEPATMLLLGSGLIGLAGFARRRFRK